MARGEIGSASHREAPPAVASGPLRGTAQAMYLGAPLSYLQGRGRSRTEPTSAGRAVPAVVGIPLLPARRGFIKLCATCLPPALCRCSAGCPSDLSRHGSSNRPPHSLAIRYWSRWSCSRCSEGKRESHDRGRMPLSVRLSLCRAGGQCACVVGIIGSQPLVCRERKVPATPHDSRQAGRWRFRSCENARHRAGGGCRTVSRQSPVFGEHDRANSRLAGLLGHPEVASASA